MSGAQSYWYNLRTQSVERADERPSDEVIGPFATAQEAEESPGVLIEHARAWLESEEGERYLSMAEDGEANPDLP